jgi:hypothetical protein
MNMPTDPKEYFVREAINHAFTLPFPQALHYLRGLTELGGDLPAINKIRDVLVHMSHSERSLDFLRSGQTELKFTS